MRPLSPFKEHAATAFYGLVDEQGIIRHVRRQALGIHEVFCTNTIGMKPADAIDVPEKIVDFD